MKESNKKAVILKSNEILADDEPILEDAVGGISVLSKYTGSEFHTSVQMYLSQHIDFRTSFKDKHRSKFNQQNLREIKVAGLGIGQTFGDIDAYRQRGYMYTLRSASSNLLLYEIKSSDFVLHLRSHGKEKEFRKWQR